MPAYSATDSTSVSTMSVIALPYCRFTFSAEHVHDLRTAYTPDKIRMAEFNIKKMSSLDDIRQLVGVDGSVLTLGRHTFEDRFYAGLIDSITDADYQIYNAQLIVSEALDSKAPEKFLEIAKHNVKVAEQAKQILIDRLLQELPGLRARTREGLLRARQEDFVYLKYGQVYISQLRPSLRQKRASAVCEWCNKEGHWKQDHAKYRCPGCSKYSPHHSLAHCPAKEDRRPRRKSKKPVRLNEDWSVMGWGEDYDDYVDDAAEHNLAT